MPADIFRTISMKASDSEKSYQWYRNQVGKLGGISGANLIRDAGRLTGTVIPGNMYLFGYDPKHKETLPYYDTLPLVLPFRRVTGGFLGINLHYLPYLARFSLLGELSRYAENKTISENTKIKISWQILEGSSKLYAATQCVKHYLAPQVKTGFLKINYTDWVTAAMLPIENFKKQSKQNVWKATGF